MADKARNKASGIEKFDGIDFGFWRMPIEDYLYGRKLHLSFLGEKPEAMKAETDRYWELLGKLCLGLLHTML